MAKTLKERMEQAVGGKAVIHLMIPDERGPVASGGIPNLGVPGGTFLVACGVEFGAGVNFSATGVPRCVTCPECIEHPHFAETYEPERGVPYNSIPEAHRAAIEKAGK